LSPEENVKGIVTNLLNYSFRGGHDSSTFLKSTVGRMTAFSQTPTKMIENYADIIKKGLGNEKDIYGDSGSATLVRALVAAGAVSYLGEKYGKKGGLHLYNMLLHVPFVNEGFASDIFGYAAHTVASAATTGDKSKHHHHEATKSLRRFVGGQTNSINVSPAWDIAKDVTQAVTSPKGFVKSIPAVQQLRSELPAKMGGAKNKNYEDTAHYLASAPKPSAERHWDKAKENQGKATIHKILKNARK